MTRRLILFAFAFLTLGCFAQSKDEVKSKDDQYPLVVRDAMRAMQHDSLPLADSLIHEAMRIRPADMGNAVLYQYLGEIYVRQKRHSEALEAFNNGLRMLPQSQSMLLDRASLYIYNDELDRALADLDDVLTLNRDEKQALFYRAYICSEKHLARKARLDYEHLIELDPENKKARIGLVLLNAEDGRPQEAMDQVNVVVRYWPKYATGYIVRGGLYQKRREYELALKDMNKAIELEPQNADFYISRGLLYKDFKKMKLCRDDLRTAVSLGANAQECGALLMSDTKKKKK